MWILGVIAAVAIAVVGLFPWWAASGPDDDLDSAEDLAVQRKWEWELQLTMEPEKALMEECGRDGGVRRPGVLWIRPVTDEERNILADAGV